MQNPLCSNYRDMINKQKKISVSHCQLLDTSNCQTFPVNCQTGFLTARK